MSCWTIIKIERERNLIGWYILWTWPNWWESFYSERREVVDCHGKFKGQLCFAKTFFTWGLQHFCETQNLNLYFSANKQRFLECFIKTLKNFFFQNAFFWYFKAQAKPVNIDFETDLDSPISISSSTHTKKKTFFSQ